MTKQGTKSPVRLETLRDGEVVKFIPALSRLRCQIFRDWPYLYDGSEDYERNYLATFAQGEGAVIAAAKVGDELVGAATAAPLRSHTSEFEPLFAAHGFDPQTVFYFGESVLLPAYRGQGIGHTFFELRETAARSATNMRGDPYRVAAFCAVVRSEHDERRPAGYRPLDPFWLKRGYRPVPGMVGNYDWQEIGSQVESPHPMQFWAREL